MALQPVWTSGSLATVPAPCWGRHPGVGKGSWRWPVHPRDVAAMGQFCDRYRQPRSVRQFFLRAGLPGSRLIARPKSSAISAVVCAPARWRLTRWASWDLESWGFLPRRLPFALATAMRPSRVRARMRSASNSATMARRVEQELPHRIVRVVDAPADVHGYSLAYELVGDAPRVRQRAGEQQPRTRCC